MPKPTKPPKPQQPLPFVFERELIFELRRIVYRLDKIAHALRHQPAATPEQLASLADAIDAKTAALAKAADDNTPGQ